MGYTHYWRSTQISQPKWAEALAECDKLVQASPVPLDIMTVGDLSDLHFNGAEDDGHEDFYIPHSVNGLEGFNFCKTAEKPYDLVVVGCLAILAETGLAVTSDGDPSDWQDGVDWASEQLGRAVAMPNLHT